MGKLLVILILIVTVPSLLIGLLVGSRTGRVWPVVFSALFWASIGTIGGIVLGWQLLPFSLAGGPHGGAAAAHLGKSILCGLAGSVICALVGVATAAKSRGQ